MEEENTQVSSHPKPDPPPSEKPPPPPPSTPPPPPKFEHTVDEVIENYVGSLGLSQIIQVVLVSFAWVFDAQSTLVTIFSDAEPDWRCKGSVGMCNGRPGGKGSSVCGLEPGAWEWVGGHKSTTIAEWGLICDHKFLAAIPASAFFIGSLIARSGIGICCLVLATEVIGRKWRGQIGQYGFFFFTIGFLTIPLIAFYNKTSWRSLHRIIAAFPFVYSLLILRLVEESPRWLLIRGNKTRALSVLAGFARRNGKTLPTDLQLLDPNLSINDDNNNSNVREGTPKMGLWGCRWARIRMSIAMVAGFGVGFVYYGIQLNVENLNFSKYLTVVINGLMEIPAVVLGSLFLGFMKRRMLFSLSCYIAGLSCLLCIIFTKPKFGAWGSWVQLGIDAIGFLTASMAFDVLYIYCVELFATNVRNFAVSMLRQALMLGASVAPVLVAVGRSSPVISFLVFGGFAVVSGLVTVGLPETKNAPLYETLEQQEKEEKKCQGGLNDGLEGEQGANGGLHNC
ncbi:hypothetical protein Cgig2_010167 [Carnegiea gigantea]|uniref:Uncharacterized protein n=1 Tax=Carnegiea gigantea TaxID=171969 RepID=A0A9Q1KHD7_9CARY|nr:hypothetical protein Cgig2_010167 [Carnegiea gigantea]